MFYERYLGDCIKVKDEMYQRLYDRSRLQKREALRRKEQILELRKRISTKKKKFQTLTNTYNSYCQICRKQFENPLQLKNHYQQEHYSKTLKQK